MNTFTPDTLMPDGKRNQLASTHDLGQNFSKAYNIKIIENNLPFINSSYMNKNLVAISMRFIDSASPQPVICSLNPIKNY